MNAARLAEPDGVHLFRTGGDPSPENHRHRLRGYPSPGLRHGPELRHRLLGHTGARLQRSQARPQLRGSPYGPLCRQGLGGPDRRQDHAQAVSGLCLPCGGRCRGGRVQELHRGMEHRESGWACCRQPDRGPRAGPEKPATQSSPKTCPGTLSARADSAHVAQAAEGGERSIEPGCTTRPAASRATILYIENQYFQNADWARDLKTSVRTT
jgi:hypothetical protein